MGKCSIFLCLFIISVCVRLFCVSIWTPWRAWTGRCTEVLSTLPLHTGVLWLILKIYVCMSWEALCHALGWLQGLSTLSTTVYIPNHLQPQRNDYKPFKPLLFAGMRICCAAWSCTGFLCCMFIDRDEERAGSQHARVVYTSTTCFFLETVPQSCKIGSKTTLEKAQEWAQKMDPAQNLQK